jgi:hypothetical protein
MYFGYFITGSGRDVSSELSIASDRPTSNSSPIPIALLKQTDGGVYFVGVEESFTVKIEDDNGLVISALKPAKLYLTPNRPEKPGFSVSKIKVGLDNNGNEYVLYDRDKGWEEFNPNKKDY